jgi:hypothetical protein
VLSAPYVIARVVTPRDGSPQFIRWSVAMRASDSTGKRSLRYRTTGTADSEGRAISFTTSVEVYDELGRWKPLEPNDRADIRKELLRLAREGIKRLKGSGVHGFEHGDSAIWFSGGAP